MNCEECLTNQAAVWCENCDADICADCDLKIHLFGILKKHVRGQKSLINESRCLEHKKSLSLYCFDCNTAVCTTCVTDRGGHTLHESELLNKVADQERKKASKILCYLNDKSAQLKDYQNVVNEVETEMVAEVKAKMDDVNAQLTLRKQRLEVKRNDVEEKLESQLSRKRSRIALDMESADRLLERLVACQELLVTNSPLPDDAKPQSTVPADLDFMKAVNSFTEQSTAVIADIDAYLANSGMRGPAHTKVPCYAADLGGDGDDDVGAQEENEVVSFGSSGGSSGGSSEKENEEEQNEEEDRGDHASVSSVAALSLHLDYGDSSGSEHSDCSSSCSSEEANNDASGSDAKDGEAEVDAIMEGGSDNSVANCDGDVWDFLRAHYWPDECARLSELFLENEDAFWVEVQDSWSHYWRDFDTFRPTAVGADSDTQSEGECEAEEEEEFSGQQEMLKDQIEILEDGLEQPHADLEIDSLEGEEDPGEFVDALDAAEDCLEKLDALAEKDEEADLQNRVERFKLERLCAAFHAVEEIGEGTEFNRLNQLVGEAETLLEDEDMDHVITMAGKVESLVASISAGMKETFVSAEYIAVAHHTLQAEDTRFEQEHLSAQPVIPAETFRALVEEICADVVSNMTKPLQPTAYSWSEGALAALQVAAEDMLAETFKVSGAMSAAMARGGEADGEVSGALLRVVAEVLTNK